MARTTEAELEELVDVLNTRTGRVYDLDWAYGGVRLVRAFGSFNVSPRYTRGELKIYLLGMMEGLDAAR